MTTLSKLEQSALLSNDPIDLSLRELLGEAQALFRVLDLTSKRITNFEHNLTESKAHFPFSYLVKKDYVFFPKNPESEDAHKLNAEPYTYVSYNTLIEWYLAWEEDGKSKKFRLFLISRKKEFTVVNIDSDSPVESRAPLFDEVSFKKPLIETDIPTRLQFAEHLHAFILGFKEYLHQYRTSIEGEDLNSDGEEIPF